MKRQVIGLAAVLVFMFSITANAVQMRNTAPLLSLSFDGTTAKCYAYITDDKGKEMDVTLELWQGNELIDSWSASGTGTVTIKGSCRVVKGKTYTLIVTGTANGASFSSPSISKTC